MSELSKAYQAVEGVVSAMQSYLESMEVNTKYAVRVYPYQNGRENGFTFAFYKDAQGEYTILDDAHYWNFHVSECRNTDQIQIIPGTRSTWDTGVTEADYKARGFVNWGDYMGAVQLIMTWAGGVRAKQENEEQKR